MSEQKEAVTAGTDDGTILKAFLIEGGRFVVEANVVDLENIMFSIRGEIKPESISDVLQIAMEFLEKIINDNGHLDK